MRTPTLLTVALLCLAACGPRPLPKRSSPVLTSTGTPRLATFAVADSRRDGVFATTGGGVLSDPATVLFQVPGESFDEHSRLASRSDSDVAFSIGDRLFRWNGTAVTNLTARLQAALIVADRTQPLRYEIDALDLDGNGDLALGVRVPGQGSLAPYGQLCFLRAAADGCESVAALINSSYGSASDLVLENGRLFVVAEYDLHVRAPDGTWSKLADDGQHGSVYEVNPLSDGRLYFHTSPSSNLPNVPSVHVLNRDGTEQSAFRGGFPVGHSPRGLWAWGIDVEDDGSCRGSFSSNCRPIIVWQQLVVSHVTLDGTATEIAHLDNPQGFDLKAVTLADGRLRLESADGAFELGAP